MAQNSKTDLPTVIVVGAGAEYELGVFVGILVDEMLDNIVRSEYIAVGQIVEDLKNRAYYECWSVLLQEYLRQRLQGHVAFLVRFDEIVDVEQSDTSVLITRHFFVRVHREYQTDSE
jgi:hypothetical protein